MSNEDMCPMASMCKGMTKKSVSGYLLMIPGLLLIMAGIIIILEPKILVWLIAVVSILMGVVLLFFANFIRKMSVH